MNAALKQFRSDIGLKQEEIAEKIGVSRQTYGNAEQGKRVGSLEFWLTLQKVFDVPLDLLRVIQKSDLRAYNQMIFTDKDCKKWFKEVRLKKCEVNEKSQ